VLVVLCFFVRSAYSAGRSPSSREPLALTFTAALAVSQGMRRLPCSPDDCSPCQPSLLVFRAWIVSRWAAALADCVVAALKQALFFVSNVRLTLTLRGSPYLEMAISFMTDVLVTAVMMWILFWRKVCRH
jgi:hypothetical protein